MSIINGNNRNNILIGTDGADTIHGNDGNDILYGAGGDDALFGDDGNDIIFGGDGQDALVGGTGNDLLFGGADNDVLNGGAGDDLLVGGDGRDLALYTNATGSVSVDLAAGTASGLGVGNDILSSVERIRGGNFADSYVATGFDAGSALPGRGTDFNEFEGLGGDDTITGNGNTRVSYLNAAAAVTVDLLAGTGQGTVPGDLAAVGLDHFTGVSSIRGSNFDDTLLGSNNATGFEQFEGRRGDDIIDGRGGLDRAVYDGDDATTSGVAVNLAAGTVTGDGSIGTDTLQSIEAVRGTEFADTYNALGFGAGSANAGSNGAFNEFEGVGGDDTITGNGNTRISYLTATAGVTVDVAAGIAVGDTSVGTDHFTGVNAVRGSTFNDALSGSNVNEIFEGFAGDDLIDGRGGFDTARYDNVVSGSSFGAVGISVNMAAGTVVGRDANATSIMGTDTLRSIESVHGTDSADLYDATGFSGTSLNAGSNGTGNEFQGDGGDDTITGNGNTRVSYLGAAAAVTVDLRAGTGEGIAPGDLAGVGLDQFTGVNSIRGSNFDDTLFGSDTTTLEQFEGRGGNDVIDGRGGLDRAVYNFDSATASGITVNLAAGTVTGDATVGTDALSSVELVRGTNFADTYNATGFSGSSTNAGSNGTFNEIEGMGGNDLITGNGNTRIAFYNATDGVTVDLTTGVAFGTAAGDLAGIGVDTILGGVNNIVGSDFADTLLGRAAADFFDGRGGNDLINGRGGFDTAIYGNDPEVTSGINVNMAAGIVTGDAAVGIDTLRAIESIRGTNFADTYDATGGDGPGGNPGFGELGALNVGSNGSLNEFEGLGGDDTIIGNGNTRISFANATGGVVVDVAAGTATGNSSVGTDTFTGVANVRGSNSVDTITGDANNNVLEGQGGDDTINGRAGNDTLTGGVGDDHFVYTATTDGFDHVTDFAGHGVGGQTDVFDFDHLAFGNGLAVGGADTGTLDASHFVANATGATTADEVFWYNTADHTLYYDADGSGDGAAVAVAVLDNNFLLNSSDFHLI